MAKKKSDAQRVAEKAVKKSHPLTVLFAVLFLLIGAAGGILLSVQLSKGDKFELRGSAVVQLSVGESYVEEGATAVSFGKDISDRVTIGGDEVKAEEGIYQVVYKVEGGIFGFFWKDYQRVRVVIVGNPAGKEEFLKGGNA